MKKTVKFVAFGRETDFLCFTVEGLLQAELMTDKSIQEIYEKLISNGCGVAMTSKLLSIALQESYPGITTKEVLDKLFESFENGHTISSAVIPLAQAVAISGPFGSAKKPEQEKEADPAIEKSVTVSGNGLKPWNRSRSGR